MMGLMSLGELRPSLAEGSLGCAEEDGREIWAPRCLSPVAAPGWVAPAEADEAASSGASAGTG